VKSYKVEFSANALKKLKKINPSIASTLFAWIKKNLDGTDNPRKHGKMLTGTLNKFWRYRVGNYRLISEINDEIVSIIIIEIGHRSTIYK